MEVKKSEDLLYIDKCFMSIKNKVAVAENLNKISLALKRIFDVNFTLKVVDNTSNTFFGMNIYPTVSTMDIMVDSIINKKSSLNDILAIWEKNEDWYVEIDSLLLYDIGLNANPPEITSVLLHEIGHVVYANTIPQRLHKLIRFKIMKLNYQMKQLISTEKIRKLFNIAIIESCSSKNYDYIDNDVEKVADRFVLQYGYGEELNSFINKLIKTQGNSMVNRSDSDMDRDITTVVNWTVLNIKELEFRKKSLRRSLKVEILKNPSELSKKVIQDIYNSFFGEVTDKYRLLLSEQAGLSEDTYNELRTDQLLDEFVARVLTEASNNIFDKKGKLKKITQNDIDILTVEAERIDTIDDKIYLLDKLYSQMELINMGLDYIESNEKGMKEKVLQSKSTLLSMKDQLNDLRSQILATKIIDRQMGIWLKMPKGYEG